MTTWILSMIMIVCISMLVGCPTSSEEPIKQTANTSRFVMRSHPPGTLLQDAGGVYWMVVDHGVRAHVSQAELLRSRLPPRNAIVMGMEEALCLRDRGSAWHGGENWDLVRMRNGQLWYVRHAERLRLGVDQWTTQSWHDDPHLAHDLGPDEEVMILAYRDLGTRELRDGTLVRAEKTLYYVWQGNAFPFVSLELAQIAGYRVNQVIEMPLPSLWAYASIDEPLTIEDFIECPQDLLRSSTGDDRDRDGVSREDDCDDQDPRRTPGRIEVCDGVDNDCNGIIDDGFDVNRVCVSHDQCQFPGVTECRLDRLGVECQSLARCE